MANMLLINTDPGPEKRVALVENDALAEYAVERPSERGIVGNIYKGRVVRVLPGMQAAFVDIGIGRAAFLYAADVVDRSKPPPAVDHSKPPPAVDREEAESDEEAHSGEGAKELRDTPPIRSLLREGQEVLVQVSKDPIGTKGARITTYVSLPGRQLVLMPTVDHVGVSRRIVSEVERDRLRELVEQIRADGTGFIVRTVAEGATEKQLVADMEFLCKLWADIEERAGGARPPCQIYSDLDLSLRTVRDLFSDEVERLIVDDQGEFARIKEFVGNFVPSFLDAVELYQGSEPLFDAFGVELEIDRALDRKVWLRSGGYLVIEQTEALNSIDVNTGRFVGHRNLEDTILRTNLEAVKEVVTQLRLRNIGGLIIIDFIDMEREADRQKVWRALRQALKADRARTKVLEISELGLVEMTRKRVRESLIRQVTVPCMYCEGKGYLKSPVTVAYDVLREIRRNAAMLPGKAVVVCVHPDVADQLADEESDHLELLEKRYHKEIMVDAQPKFHVEQFEIHVTVDR